MLEELKKTVCEANLELPEQLDDEITLTGVRIEGDYLEFEASIDEDVVSVEEVLDGIEEIRAEFKEEVTLHLYDYFDESDELLRLVVKEGKGMRLVFVFEKSGIKLTLLEFTPEELAAYVRM